MQISVVAKSDVEKKRSDKGTSYSMFELTYKSDGQTLTKKLMNWDRDVYPVLKEADPGDVFEIESVKKGNFWNWIKASKVDGTSTAPAAARTTTSSTTSKGTWETPEERAQKQIYIARSVALGQAVLYNASKSVDVNEVLNIANTFEQWLLAPVHGLPESLDEETSQENDIE
jgi:hypothetical protein